MIFGTGIDMVDVRRIQASLERHADRFAQRILHPDEMQVFEQRGGAASLRAQRFVAGRFACKEAFSKAWGTGIGDSVGFQDLCILNNEKGAPVLIPQGDVAARFEREGLLAWVSLSDEGDWVIAQVILERITAVR